MRRPLVSQCQSISPSAPTGSSPCMAEKSQAAGRSSRAGACGDCCGAEDRTRYPRVGQPLTLDADGRGSFLPKKMMHHPGSRPRRRPLPQPWPLLTTWRALVDGRATQTSRHMTYRRLTFPATTAGRDSLICSVGLNSGAAVGYHRAGFDVVGVDIEPQPHYPFEFYQADALTVMDRHLGMRWDAIHASPPCQAHTGVPNRREHPDLIPPTRALLEASGLPWVMENVPGAEMGSAVLLCEATFGLTHNPPPTLREVPSRCWRLTPAVRNRRSGQRATGHGSTHLRARDGDRHGASTFCPSCGRG